MKSKIINPDAHLFFHYCNGVGPKRFSLIKKAFGGADKAFKACKQQWLELGFTPKLVENIFQHKMFFDIKQTKQDLAKQNIHYISQEDQIFPKLLTEIADCPIGLFIKGSLVTTDIKAIAVVGTRKATSYGQEITQRFVTSLVSRGFTIVSGLARGIDGIAHKTALDIGGRTIAVMGCGLDVVYPPEHKVLAAQIAQHGALISEYPPQTKINPGNFPARNRIISGLSLGVLVTEGSIQSGTNITAMMAVEQNRDVFAIPGPITSQMSQGPGKLIQMGAKLVLAVEDILSELQIAGVDLDVDQKLNGQKSITTPQFDDHNQEQIWQFLLSGNQHIDNISRSVRIPVTSIMTALTMMELRGIVKNLGEGIWMAS